MFHWFQKRRRAALLEEPFPAQWNAYLEQNIGQFSQLTATEKTKLRKLTHVMVKEKDWEGQAGQAMIDEIKVTVAGTASLMLLGVDDFFFDNVRTVIVFPHPVRRETNSGWIIDRDTYPSGEAYQGGPVVLSWQDVLADGRTPGNGHNLVIHEFAHCLDSLDGEMGGSLEFDNPKLTRRWNQICQEEFDALTACARSGQETLINDYGATNKAEFFAVCSETFFEKPVEMHQRHSELFELLLKYYQIDPRNWISK